jgi:hypothetical protein
MENREEVPMRRMVFLGVAAILVLPLLGCSGGSDRNVIAGPGFVGIDDSVADTAPFLTVNFVDVLGRGTAFILSNPVSDGDIALVDPVQNVYAITTDASPLFFGVDSFGNNQPEYKAFLTFPLDGSTGQDILPLGATITSATVELFVTEVSFADTVPTFLDLVPYGVLGPEDFDAGFLDFLSFDFFSSDPGNFVLIEITPLVQTAQNLALLDFQIRLSLDDVVSPAGTQVARPQAVSNKAVRTVSPSSAAVKRPARTPRTGGSPLGAGAERPARSR